jgi:hypothetical protein
VADRQFLERLTRELIDQGKLMEAGWVAYRLQVLHPSAGKVQLDETRLAFFAGAQHLWGSINGMLDDGINETPTDMRRMGQINDELNKFSDQLKLRVTRSEGSA